MGVSPHLLVQTAHEWRARLLRGCPPLPLWLGSCPYLALEESPILLRHAMRLERTLPCRWAPPFYWARAARLLHPRSVPCHIVRQPLGSAPLLLAWHALRWERKLPYRGSPPSPCPRPHAVGTRGLSPLF